MKNSYTKQLEKIIKDMRSALDRGANDITENDYLLWLAFLRLVDIQDTGQNTHVAITEPEAVLIPPAASLPLKRYTDLGNLMELAELRDYPTWYVQPHYLGDMLLLDYEQGELLTIRNQNNGSIEKTELPEAHGIPKNIPAFTGTVSGTRLTEEVFIADDIEEDTSIAEKLEWLQQAGFTTGPLVIFPTGKTMAKSSDEVLASFQRFLTDMTKGPTDGLLVMSDEPLFDPDDQVHPTRITFSLSNS